MGFMHPSDVPRVREFLADSLRHLASEPAEQIEFVRSLGVGVDELALDFDDWSRLIAPGQPEVVPPLVVGLIRELDQLLDSMGPGDENWDEAAIQDSPTWSAIRHVARAALALMEPATASA